jgi:hypothetical protein
MLFESPRDVGADQLCHGGAFTLGNNPQHSNIVMVEPNHLIMPVLFGTMISPLLTLATLSVRKLTTF